MPPDRLNSSFFFNSKRDINNSRSRDRYFSRFFFKFNFLSSFSSISIINVNYDLRIIFKTRNARINFLAINLYFNYQRQLLSLFYFYLFKKKPSFFLRTALLLLLKNSISLLIVIGGRTGKNALILFTSIITSVIAIVLVIKI